MPYVPPKFNLQLFNCPLCNAYSIQTWFRAIPRFEQQRYVEEYVEKVKDVYYCFCLNCRDYTIWVDEKTVYPLINGAPLPHPDMPKEVKDIYNEARGILFGSPRSSCALLRVSLEVLVDDIMNKNKKPLFDNIGILVEEKKLPTKIQKAMDVLRITANSMLHPSAIDLENKEDRQTAIGMFDLLNIITEVLIAEPKRIDNYFDGLPDPQKSAVEKRDSTSNQDK